MVDFTTDDLRKILEINHYEPNILEYYDNVTYNIRFYMLNHAFQKRFSSDRLDGKYFIVPDNEKIIIAETGVSEHYSVTSLQISSVHASAERNPSAATYKLEMRLHEVDGCDLVNKITAVSKAVGYESYIEQPYHIDIWFSGYEHSTGKPIQVIENMVLTYEVLLSEVKTQVDNNGCEYNFNKLNDSNALFPTNCYMLFVGKTTSPDRHQVSKYLQYKIIDDIYHESYIGLDEHGYEEYNKVPPIDEPFGPYRNDALISTYAFRRRTSFNHIKTYRPVWSEMSPTFALAQSDINRTPSHYSFLNWFNRKQNENIISPYTKYITDSNGENHYTTIRYNDPDITEITHTSYDVPTYSKLDKTYIGYTVEANNQEKQQGDNYEISAYYRENKIYYFGEKYPIKYDPTLYYNLISLGYIDENGIDQCSDDQTVNFDSDGYIKAYLYGNPSTGELFLNKDQDYTYPHSKYNYITYKTSKVHKLWFSNTHKDTILSKSIELYNQAGNSNIYEFTENSINLEYTVIGIFDEHGKQVTYNSGSINCYVRNHKYSLVASEFINDYGQPVTAASILFRVKITQGSMDESTDSSVDANMIVYCNGTMPAMIYGSVSDIAREED